MAEHLGPYDPDRLGWTWAHPDPSMDHLQQELAALVEARLDEDAAGTFGEIDALIRCPGGRLARTPVPRIGLEWPRARPAPSAHRALVLLQRAHRRPAGTPRTPRMSPGRMPPASAVLGDGNGHMGQHHPQLVPQEGGVLVLEPAGLDQERLEEQPAHGQRRPLAGPDAGRAVV